MPGENGDNDDNGAVIRSMEELGMPENIQRGRLFYHFRSAPDPSLSRERVIVPQLDWDEVRNEMNRLTLENQKLKDVIIAMHLNPHLPVNYRGYNDHGSSSRNDQNLERVVTTGSLASISSGASQASNALHESSFVDDSASIASLPSDRTADTEEPEASVPADLHSEGTIDSVIFETPSETSISGDINSENDAILDTGYESSSNCSTIRIVEVEDDFSDTELEPAEPAEAENQTSNVDGRSESDIHNDKIRQNDSEPRYHNRPGTPNNSLTTPATLSVEQEYGTSDFWVSQRDNTRSNGRLNYNVPEDIDPDQDDVLSDVETVQSDQALTAWGIEEDTTSEEAQPTLDEKGVEIGSVCSDEEGWEEFPRKINSTPNLRLYNFQALTNSGNAFGAIDNIKPGPGALKKEDTLTLHRDHVSGDTIRAPINPKTIAPTKAIVKANSDQTPATRLERRELAEGDERLQKNQPRPSTAILDWEISEGHALAARRKDAVATTSATGTKSSIFPPSDPLTSPLDLQNLDTFSIIPLVPITLTRSTERIIQSQRSVEWMNPKPTLGSDDLRIQPQGEKNTLGVSDITKNRVKAVNESISDGSSIRATGVIEMKFQNWKENRSKDSSSSNKVGQTINNTSSTGTKAQKTMAEDMQTPAIKNLSPSIPLKVNNSVMAKQTVATKESQNMPIRTPKASHKVISPGSHRNRSQKVITSSKISSKEPSRFEEPELNHKKSIRFSNSLTSTGTEAPESQSTKIDTNNKPLVSILKPPGSAEPPTPPTPLSDNSRIYNYEYIREIVVHNLPRDITLAGLLSQVRGGLLEKVLIYPHDLSVRLVFVEPEAARRFYNHIHRTGFFVPTEISAVEAPAIKERMVRCTLHGFIWTPHSCEIPVHMIQNLWKHCATRCLTINNFPKDVGGIKFVEDMLKLLNIPAVEAKYVIEGTLTERDSSKTGVLVRVGFSCIQYAFRVFKELPTYSPLYSSVVVLYDKDPCGGLISKAPPSFWAGGKEIGNDKPAAPLSAIRPQAPVQKPTPPPRPSSPKKPIMNGRAGIVAAWNQFEAKGQAVPITKAPVNPPIMSGAPPTADISIAFKGFPAPKRTRKSPEEPNPSFSATIKPPTPTIQIEKSSTQGISSPAVFGPTTYDNWEVGLSLKNPEPPAGAHWNYYGEKTAREYNEAITKKIRRMPEGIGSSDERPKIDNLRPDHPLINRMVYLKNLPRNFHVARLFRFIRGGMVEHVELKPPNSEYNTSSAIIVFVDRNSVKNYKAYLNSPGLTVDKNHRVVFAENIAPDIIANIRSLSHNDSRTRCLHIESLPKDTMLGEFLGIIEESMNHSNLEFEHATVRESKGCSEAFLRLLSIGTAAFVAQVLERSYTGITITYDRDPCEGPLEELDEVNLELEG